MKNARTIKYLITLFAVLLAIFASQARAEETVKEHKMGNRFTHVVFQMSDDDPKKWSLMLNNVKNVQQELGTGNADIEVVTFGPGVNMLKLESTVADRVDEALNAGVKIVACENTMRSLKLGKSDMMSTIAYVPAGVVEIIKKQNEGYAYIRP